MATSLSSSTSSRNGSGLPKAYLRMQSSGYSALQRAASVTTKVFSPAGAVRCWASYGFFKRIDVSPNNSLQRTNGLRPFAAELMIR